MSNNYSVVYQSSDGNFSASNHLDIIDAEDELLLLTSEVSVVFGVVCIRLERDFVLSKLRGDFK